MCVFEKNKFFQKNPRAPLCLLPRFQRFFWGGGGAYLILGLAGDELVVRLLLQVLADGGQQPAQALERLLGSS
jgi:hypothetical protein